MNEKLTEQQLKRTIEALAAAAQKFDEALRELQQASSLVRGRRVVVVAGPRRGRRAVIGDLRFASDSNGGPPEIMVKMASVERADGKGNMGKGYIASELYRLRDLRFLPPEDLDG